MSGGALNFAWYAATKALASGVSAIASEKLTGNGTPTTELPIFLKIGAGDSTSLPTMVLA